MVSFHTNTTHFAQVIPRTFTACIHNLFFLCASVRKKNKTRWRAKTFVLSILLNWSPTGLFPWKKTPSNRSTWHVKACSAVFNYTLFKKNKINTQNELEIRLFSQKKKKNKSSLLCSSLKGKQNPSMGANGLPWQGYVWSLVCLLRGKKIICVWYNLWTLGNHPWSSRHNVTASLPKLAGPILLCLWVNCSTRTIM